MANTTISTILATTAVLALAACGGGSTGANSFEQISSTGLNLISDYGNTPVTPVLSMPIGTATYRGAAAFSTETSDPNQIIQTARTVSEVEVIANFSSSTISGRAFNFKFSDPTLPDITMSGELAITNGVITQNQLTANLSGTLTENTLNMTLPVTYNGTIAGSFVGDNAVAALGTGTAVGTADLSPFGGSSNFSQTAYAVWGVERSD